MRLEYKFKDTDGWGTAIDRVDTARLAELQLACLTLSEASGGGHLSWRLVDRNDRNLEHTVGHGAAARWQQS